MLRKSKLKAFTLLECLVALLVISGSVLVYNGLTRVLSANIVYLSRHQETDWLLFVQQLQLEWSEARFEKVEHNKVYVTKGNQTLAYGISKRDDFRKTSGDNRGYQPMLFGLDKCQIIEKNGRVALQLTFKSGLERTVIYDFKG
ncbi:competence type IV pilus minor pilin ComGF [Streptococcus sp. zg-JUN1979]|uniref:competence type IV pilus minor pilin ComGF n=1 Tax=Streptococcus sp. zg-JUN1979 TaxID=3391450 RepID=UPI0039A6E13E